MIALLFNYFTAGSLESPTLKTSRSFSLFFQHLQSGWLPAASGNCSNLIRLIPLAITNLILQTIISLCSPKGSRSAPSPLACCVLLACISCVGNPRASSCNVVTYASCRCKATKKQGSVRHCHCSTFHKEATGRHCATPPLMAMQYESVVTVSPLTCKLLFGLI